MRPYLHRRKHLLSNMGLTVLGSLVSNSSLIVFLVHGKGPKSPEVALFNVLYKSKQDFQSVWQWRSNIALPTHHHKQCWTQESCLCGQGWPSSITIIKTHCHLLVYTAASDLFSHPCWGLVLSAELWALDLAFLLGCGRRLSQCSFAYVTSFRCTWLPAMLIWLFQLLGWHNFRTSWSSCTALVGERRCGATASPDGHTISPPTHSLISSCSL